MSDDTIGTGKTTSRRSMLRLAVPAAAGVAALAATGAGEILHAPAAHAANGDPINIGQVNTGTGLTQLNNSGSTGGGMFWMIDEAPANTQSYALVANSQHNAGFYGIAGDGLLNIPTLNKATNGVYGLATHSNNDDGQNNTGYGVVAHANNANAPLLLISNRTGVPNNSSANGSVTVDGNNGSMYNVRFSAWYPLASVNLLSHPIRVINTRGGGAPITNGGHPLTAGATLAAQITGTAVGGISVPAHATAIIANMVAVPTSNGDLTIWADGVAKPTSSNLNYSGGVNIANFVICALSSAGKVDIYSNAGTTDVILDITGFII